MSTHAIEQSLASISSDSASSALEARLAAADATRQAQWQLSDNRPQASDLLRLAEQLDEVAGLLTTASGLAANLRDDVPGKAPTAG